LALAVNTVNDVTNAAAVRRRGKRCHEQRPPAADARVLDGYKNTSLAIFYLSTPYFVGFSG
jgi:hypothetical protein